MTLTVILSLATSLFFGGSDFLGGVASRRDSAFPVTATSQMLGGALMLVAALLVGGTLARGDVAWAALAGLSGGVGITALYGAISVGRMSIVTPVAAALSGAVPATVDLVRGTTIAPLTMAGILLALVAVIIVSVSAEDDGAPLFRRPSAAIVLAVVAGLGFGVSLLSFSFTAPSSGLWPLVVGRVVSLMFAGTLALIRTRHLLAHREARPAALGAGALDAAANVTMINALRLGPLAVAAVLCSLYPVVVVLLARGVLGERLRPLQRAGVALAMVAVVLTAVT
jgi:drug/metabolite transporter (DMT)-like permease